MLCYRNVPLASFDSRESWCGQSAVTWKRLATQSFYFASYSPAVFLTVSKSSYWG